MSRIFRASSILNHPVAFAASGFLQAESFVYFESCVNAACFLSSIRFIRSIRGLPRSDDEDAQASVAPSPRSASCARTASMRSRERGMSQTSTAAQATPPQTTST